MRGFFFYLFSMLFFLSGYAQKSRVWQEIKAPIEKRTPSEANLLKEYKVFSLRPDLLNENLSKVSASERNDTPPVIVEFPDNHGDFIRFSVKQSAVMDPELASKFPAIRTYKGRGLENTGESVYFTVSPLGLHVMILSPERGQIFIEPADIKKSTYNVFSKKNIRADQAFECLTVDRDIQKSLLTVPKSGNDLKLRKYRLAVAATEEYSDYFVKKAGLGQGNTHNDSIAVVLSSIVVTMARVNAIYERDLAVTMQLVGNNDQLIFLPTDPGNDPYTNGDVSAMLTQNINTVNAIIGINNYDIGHVFGTGNGGLANLSSVCTTSKAGGVSALNDPYGDIFAVDYVSHEMGHQFGAHHTFNGNASNCGNGNRYNPTAVEPGSGSTIMAYAGICTPQNVQMQSDSYFHGISIGEINTFLGGTGQCAVNSDFLINTAVPIVNAGSDYTIPKSTPFILKGLATDADGDVLTYCWEEMDNQVTNIQIPPSSTQLEGAVFRSVEPKEDSARYLSALSNVISGNISSTWEVVPSVSRVLNFRLTVRDNVPGEGQTGSDDMKVTVNATAGPFRVTSQNTDNIIWEPGTSKLITWDVAGTTGNGVNTSHVNILLSLDGGLTFPVVLASNTNNDGQKYITVPDMPSSNVRIMVAASDNIYYAVNEKKLSIGSFETTCTNYNATDVPKSIPDNNSVGVTSVLNVPDNFILSDVNVGVTINHTWIADLQLFLIAPDGTTVLIYDRSCAPGIRRENINAVFDDAADAKVCDNSKPAVWGTTKPDNLLSAFNGLSSAGTWKLKIVDNAAQDVGSLTAWSLQLCQTNPVAGIEDDLFGSFKVYPNPFGEKLNVLLTRSVSDDPLTIKIFDLQGRIVYTRVFSDIGSDPHKELDLENLTSGMYFLQFKVASQISNMKIVKY